MAAFVRTQVYKTFLEILTGQGFCPENNHPTEFGEVGLLCVCIHPYVVWLSAWICVTNLHIFVRWQVPYIVANIIQDMSSGQLINCIEEWLRNKKANPVQINSPMKQLTSPPRIRKGVFCAKISLHWQLYAACQSCNPLCAIHHYIAFLFADELRGTHAGSPIAPCAEFALKRADDKPKLTWGPEMKITGGFKRRKILDTVPAMTLDNIPSTMGTATPSNCILF